jgi:hypothetical protein
VSSQTINYSWTPSTYGVYNFTAYAPPLIGETYTIDNKRTEIIPLHKVNLFDGLFLNYSISIWGDTYPLEYVYSSLSDGIFHVEHTVYTEFGPEMGAWDVNSQTRIMTNAFGGFNFGIGTHTPLWIFTEISLNDIISIAVDGEGDHNFIVSGESTYNLPGFGTVDVWVLEDLTVAEGIALYEKSTGILLNGTFFFFGGSYNYTLELFNTNASFKIKAERIPGYNIFFFATTIGVLSLIIALRKRRKYS